MRIIITENQYSKLVEQVVVKCVPTGETEFNKIDISFYDMLYNGSILNYGDYDVDKTHPIYVIQKKLGIGTDGYYGKDMLKALSNQLNIDLCKQIFGSYKETCKQLDMKPMLSEPLPKQFHKDYSDTPILIDTREQKPLHFNNSELLKLDVGDYAVGGELYDYTFVDRKSYQDFCSTVTNGYNRFIKELDSCRS